MSQNLEDQVLIKNQEVFNDNVAESIINQWFDYYTVHQIYSLKTPNQPRPTSPHPFTWLVWVKLKGGRPVPGSVSSC